MNRRFLLRIKALTVGCIIIFITLIIFQCCKTKPDKIPDGVKEDALSIGEEDPEWFHNAKFGMFIHWGPYSQLAGEWNGRHVEVGKEAEWIMKDLSIPVNKYRELAHKMNPVRFDAMSGFVWQKLPA